MKPFYLSLIFIALSSSSFGCNPPSTPLSSKNMLYAPDRVVSLPGLGCVDDLQLAGLLPVTSAHNRTRADNMPGLFYWFVESRDHAPDAPIVVWLNGGPGAASTYGFFLENGPYSVSKEGILTKRQHSWTNHANYLVIDQPAGVGLSYGSRGDYRNEDEAMDQFYQAIQLFFKRYPKLASRPLYLTGESYAGKYIPQLAVRILAGNTPQNTIRLAGVVIGDGWVNPRLQQSADADFAYSHGLIDFKTRTQVAKLYQQCADELDKSTPSSARANQVCNQTLARIKQESGLSHLANIHTGKEPDDGPMIRYLNQPDVRKALHIDHANEFESFNQMASETLEEGEQDSVADLYAVLLEKGIRVMIFNGLYDGLDCNFMGTDKWLAALKWKNAEQFADAKTCAWHVNGDVAGYAKTSSGLTQIKVRNAGHLAPSDQPEILENLLNRFITQQAFCQPTESGQDGP